MPVLLNETINSLNIKNPGIFIDCTFGQGGHSKLILNNITHQSKLYAIDKDPSTIKYAKEIIHPNFKFIHGSFSNILQYTKQYNITGKVNGILLDLGTSISQLTVANRGFSFLLDGPLDMRMNPSHGISAKQWINSSAEHNIATVLKNFGDERFAKKIAHAIIQYRLTNKLISRTSELSNIIQKIVPNQNRKKHPATRSFQAIRIFINNEIKELKILLKHTLKILKPGGRLSIISFHSLEDKIVKKFIIKHSQKITIPRNVPITEIQRNKLSKVSLKKIKKIVPSITEINLNPHSRSAILRVAEMIKK
ncbi:16S rRNA (cytosine(1402)-N(4))-methyltransferase RsmH [Buchnera aphidicola (Hormaphis cornu)]|nr:16S rRNA (cytosine(1402)-N(4))-methyltransferase RsmH [Buchnera aphidicola (Hormaphis cornu)]